MKTAGVIQELKEDKLEKFINSILCGKIYYTLLNGVKIKFGTYIKKR